MTETRTEALNQTTVDIDTPPVAEGVRLINLADRSVPAAVTAVLPAVTRADARQRWQRPTAGRRSRW